jgi:hypothetical protein
MPNWDEPGVRYDDRRTYDEVLNQEKKITTMFDIVLDVRGLTGPELIQRAKNIAAGVTSEAVFAPLAADVTALNTLITSAEALQAAKATREAAYRNAVAACDDSDDEIAAALKVIGSKVGPLPRLRRRSLLPSCELKVSPPPNPCPVKSATWFCPLGMRKANSTPPGTAWMLPTGIKAAGLPTIPAVPPPSGTCSALSKKAASI